MTLLLLNLKFAADDVGAIGIDKQRIRQPFAVLVQYDSIRQDEAGPVIGVFAIRCKWPQDLGFVHQRNVGKVKCSDGRAGHSPTTSRHFQGCGRCHDEGLELVKGWRETNNLLAEQDNGGMKGMISLQPIKPRTEERMWSRQSGLGQSLSLRAKLPARADANPLSNRCRSLMASGAKRYVS